MLLTQPRREYLAPKVIRPPAASINYVPDPQCEPAFDLSADPTAETPPPGGLEAYA